MKRKCAAILLTAAMILSLLPTGALAMGGNLDVPAAEETAPMAGPVPPVEFNPGENPASPFPGPAAALSVEAVGEDPSAEGKGIALLAAKEEEGDGSEEEDPTTAVVVTSTAPDGQVASKTLYILNHDSHTALLYGCAEEGDVNGTLIIPETISYNDRDYTVTEIAEKALKGQTGMTQAWLPQTIECIGAGAFMNCDHVKAIGSYDGEGNADPYALPNGLSKIYGLSFFGCTRLSSIVVPARVDTIEWSSFAYCYSLGQNYTDAANVTYGVYFAPGSRLKSIQQEAFSNCIVLENITLPDSLRSISYRAFYKCAGQVLDDDGAPLENRGLKKLVLPDGLQEIGEEAFSCCASLTELSIPASLTVLPFKSFYSCFSLKKVVFRGDTLKEMGGSAFFCCRNLAAIETAGTDRVNALPSTLKSIPQHAFAYCDSLKEIEFAEGLEEIGPYAFNESGLQRVCFPDSLKEIELLAFGDCLSLTEIQWGNRPANEPLLLGDMAFFSCDALQSVVLPKLWVNSGTDLFYDCNGLKTVSIAEDAVFVPTRAFRDCDALKTLRLGSSLTRIGEQAFYSCPQLDDVDFSIAAKLEVIKPLAFCRTSFTTVSLPASIREIGLNAFGINRKLLSLEAAPGNPGGYTSTDGILYQDNGTVLVKYPAGKPDSSFAVPEGVAEIAADAFSHTEALKELTFPSSLQSIGNYAFGHCIQLATAKVPSTVRQGVEIFEGCYKMLSGTVAENITVIEQGTFPANSKITRVEIPAWVDTVKEGALQNLTKLQEIVVDENNPYYTAVDGVLFTKDKSTLVSYPAARPEREYVIPGEVIRIGFAAFTNAACLEHLTIPKNVEQVQISACYNAFKLSRLDIYRENLIFDTVPNSVSYKPFLGKNAAGLQVYLTGNPVDIQGAEAYSENFWNKCGSGYPVDRNNIHVGYFKPVTEEGDRFVEAGIVYTLSDASTHTVTVGENRHYAGTSLTIPGRVIHEGSAYTVTQIEPGAFTGAAGLTHATVMLNPEQIGSGAFDSSVTICGRDSLAGFTIGESSLSYGDTLVVNAPLSAAEGTSVLLEREGRAVSAEVKGGTAVFPVNRDMIDAFGFGTVTVSAKGGEAATDIFLTLSPKTFTMADLPWRNNRHSLLVTKPYDGTNILDIVTDVPLQGFALSEDDVALHITGQTDKTEASPQYLGLVSNPCIEFTGEDARYYAIDSDSDLFGCLRANVGYGQLYMKEVDGVLQQPTFRRVWASEDGMRVRDCGLAGGQFVAYIPTKCENGAVVEYETVDVSGSISYDEVNHYPAFDSFDEIGVEQDRAYHWVFVPSDNGDRQAELANYRFYGTVTLWDTDLERTDGTLVGKVGENLPLPGYVTLEEEEVPFDVPKMPGPSEPITSVIPTPSAPDEPDTPDAPDTPDTPDAPSVPSVPSVPSGPIGEEPFLPNTAVTEEEIAAATGQFPDIADYWGKEDAAWAYREGLFRGTAEHTFSPDSATDRAMFATVLYRLTGEPEVTVEELSFADIADNAYYTKAVAWASSQGIVSGLVENQFGPHDMITREQLTVMLYRMSGEPSVSAASLSAFRDGDTVSHWAQAAMAWAVEQKLLNGKGNGILDPQGFATRGEASALLRRFCQLTQ